MTFKVRVILENEVSFTSESEQNELLEKIDSVSFTAPTFVGIKSKNKKHVVITTRVTDIDISNLNDIGQAVADYFDTEYENVRVNSN
mgnify:CR=1 FL=1